MSIWRMNSAAFISKVTMVFQNGALFDSLTLRENVAFPLRERSGLEENQIREMVDELLGMVGSQRDCGPLACRYFHRHEAIDRNYECACGQPKRSTYDEPTSILDPIMARRLVNLIAEFKVRLKLTTILVTHDMRPLDVGRFLLPVDLHRLKPEDLFDLFDEWAGARINMCSVDDAHSCPEMHNNLDGPIAQIVPESIASRGVPAKVILALFKKTTLSANFSTSTLAAIRSHCEGRRLRITVPKKRRSPSWT